MPAEKKIGANGCTRSMAVTGDDEKPRWRTKTFNKCSGHPRCRFAGRKHHPMSARPLELDAPDRVGRLRSTDGGVENFAKKGEFVQAADALARGSNRKED